MSTFQVTGKFKFYCYSDGGGRYEPYGSFSIEAEATIQNIWSEVPDGIAIPNKKFYSKPFKFQVAAPDNFPTTGYLTLHGIVKEYDPHSSDDLIGNYEEEMIDVKNIYQKSDTFTYRGKDTRDYVQITLRVDPL